MNYSVGQYKNLPLLVFPMRLGSGFVIIELKGLCSNCNKEIVEVRGEVFEYVQCSDVQFAGLCQDCKLLVTCRFRYYKDGHVLSCHGDEWRAMLRHRKISFIFGDCLTEIKKMLFQLMDWIFRWRR